MQDSLKAVKNIILASFLADSHALGVQWVYDLKKLDPFLPLQDLLSHPSDGFHKGKQAGEFTNYGDHIFHLLQFLDNRTSFEIQTYADSWFQFFESYQGYKDHASKTTFKRLTNSKTAVLAKEFPVADMAAAVHFAPFLLVTTEPDKVLSLALEESTLFYDHALIADFLRLLVPMVIEAMGGTPPRVLVERASKKAGPVADLLKKGWESGKKDTREAVLNFGATCGVDGGISIIGHLVAKYPDNLFDGLRANATGGGDIAARSIGYAMLMAAYHGISALPSSWLQTLKKGKLINEIITRRYA